MVSVDSPAPGSSSEAPIYFSISGRNIVIWAVIGDVALHNHQVHLQVSSRHKEEHFSPFSPSYIGQTSHIFISFVEAFSSHVRENVDLWTLDLTYILIIMASNDFWVLLNSSVLPDLDRNWEAHREQPLSFSWCKIVLEVYYLDHFSQIIPTQD